jgi:hypothetical protein
VPTDNAALVRVPAGTERGTAPAGLPNLTSWQLGVANIRCGVFKVRFDTDSSVL